MYTIYCGIDILCGHCGATTRCNFHIMWKNQHGVKIRVFCRHCGAMTDKTNVYRMPWIDTNIHTMRDDIKPLPWQPGYESQQP